MVFQQYREIVTADSAFQDLDMDIRVTMEKKGNLKFEATLWNLTKSTWNSISKDDIVQIKGGWEDGPVEVLVYGKINSLNREPDGNDLKFTLKGVDQSKSALNARISDTWSDTDPGDIAAEIATKVGLTAQTVKVGEKIRGNWSATPDKKARAWLKELVEIAGEKTGAEWEFHGEQGELSFQPKNQTYREAPILSWENNLISIGPVEDAESDTEKVEFEVMLTPGIAKGAAVDVQVEGYNDIWKVERYEHQTATAGDHYTQGVLLPTEVDYQVQSNRRVNTDVRGIDRLGV